MPSLTSKPKFSVDECDSSRSDAISSRSYALLDAPDDLHGGLHADVGGYEHLLQIVQHLVVDLRTARDRAGELRKESRFGLLQPLGQLPTLLRGRFGLLRLAARLGRGRLRGRIILFLFEKIEKSHVTVVLWLSFRGARPSLPTKRKARDRLYKITSFLR